MNFMVSMSFWIPPPIVLGSDPTEAWYLSTCHRIFIKKLVAWLKGKRRVGHCLEDGVGCLLVVGCWLLSPFSLVVLLECDGDEIKQ